MSDSRRYKFGPGGDSLTEVGIGNPGGEIIQIKFQTAVPVCADEPVWVSLGRRILELEKLLTLKAAEFVRMENSWRREVEHLEHKKKKKK